MKKIDTESIRLLRNLTSFGLMECKKALQEANGNIEQATDILKKKGRNNAIKLRSRTAKNGIVRAIMHKSGEHAIIMEINCESAECANLSKFEDLVNLLVKEIQSLEIQNITLEKVVEAYDKHVLDLSAVVREKIEIRSLRVIGKNASKENIFVKNITNSTAVAIVTEGLEDKAIGEQICDQVPLHEDLLTCEGVDFQDSNIDLEKFLNQPFIHDESITIQDVLNRKNAKLKKCILACVGSGIEEKEEKKGLADQVQEILKS